MYQSQLSHVVQVSKGWGQHSAVLTWPQVATQTRDICKAFGGASQRPTQTLITIGPLSQTWSPGGTMASGGSAGPSDQYVP